MIKKIDILRVHMERGEWDKALALAARFPRLGEHRDAIIGGHNARLYPRFYREIGKDPDAVYQAGIDALKARYTAA